MFGKPLIGSCLFVLGLTLAAVPAQAAPITIAGVTYDSVNFADTLVSSSGTFTTAGGALASVVTDVSVDTYAFSLETGSYLQLSFTNNTPINGIGNDLVLFEIGTPDNFGLSLTVGGPIVSLASVSSGFSQSGGFGINVASIDLALLGVAPLSTINSIVINMGPSFAATSSAPTLGAIVAVNNSDTVNPVPEPASMISLLLASGFVMAGSRRFNRK